MLCPSCLHEVPPGAAACEHARPTYVCPACGRCSCMAPPERRLRVPEAPAAGSGAFERWRQGRAEPDPELWERLRAHWERLRVLPVGLEDGVLYGLAEAPGPGLEEEVFRELAPELPDLRRVRLRRPPGFAWPTEALRPAAGYDPTTGVAWDWDGVEFRPGPAEVSALEARGFRYGGWLYAVPDVEVEGEVPPDRPLRVGVRRGALELAVLRALAGPGPAAAWVRDGFLQAAAEACGFRLMESLAEAVASVRPVVVEGRTPATVVLMKPGRSVGRALRLRVDLLEAGPGMRVRVRLRVLEAPQTS